MSTTRIKNKLSTLVASQLPEFIREDYTTFLSFIQAYFEFLEQDQQPQEIIQNALSYSNIDQTIDSFIANFYKQYCASIPQEILADKKLLLKYVQDLYKNVGNSKGFNLLFRILFNKDVELFYPSTAVLKPSDGKWRQDSIIFIQVLDGNPDSIVQKYVSINNAGIKTSFPLLIKEKRTIEVRSESGIVTSENIFAYVFDNSKNIPINPGDGVYILDFKGVVVPTPVKGVVVNGGGNFKVGDVFSVGDPFGYGLRFKVSKVDREGALQGILITDFGINYQSDFYAYISTSKKSESIPYQFSGGTLALRDDLNGFVDFGAISSHDYTFGEYVDVTYVGTTLSFFKTDSSVITGTVDLDAVLYFTLGAKAITPGYYEDNRGFLSDNIFIQDDNFYIPYSYVVKTEERLKDFKKAVLEILHPVGTKLHGEQILENVFDLSVDIETDVKSTSLLLKDATQGFIESVVTEVTKVITDNVILLESPIISFNKVLSDDVTGLEDSITQFATLREVYDTVTTDDSNLILEVTKVLSDTYNVEDYANLTANIVLSDTYDVSESAVLTVEKVFSDNTEVTDEVASIDQTIILFSNITSVTDVITAIDQTKGLESNVSVIEVITSIDQDKVLSDSVTIDDTNILLNVDKVLSDLITILDSTELFSNIDLLDNFSVEDILVKTANLAPTDSITLTDIDLNFEVDKVLEDNAAIEESISLDANKYITDTSSTSDNGSILLNPYDSEQYFLEDYVGDPVIF